MTRDKSVATRDKSVETRERAKKSYYLLYTEKRYSYMRLRVDVGARYEEE
jgi:hypothetical protein